VKLFLVINLCLTCDFFGYAAPDLDQSSIYGAWKIDDTENSFSTQTFRIKYAKQDVHLCMMIAFNLSRSKSVVIMIFLSIRSIWTSNKKTNVFSWIFLPHWTVLCGSYLQDFTTNGVILKFELIYASTLEDGWVIKVVCSLAYYMIETHACFFFGWHLLGENGMLIGAYHLQGRRASFSGFFPGCNPWIPNSSESFVGIAFVLSNPFWCFTCSTCWCKCTCQSTESCLLLICIEGTQVC
jgi:hypothetical protein